MNNHMAGNVTAVNAKPVLALAITTAIISVILVAVHAPGFLWAVPSIVAAVLAFTWKQRGVGLTYALVALAIVVFFAAVGVLGGGWLTGSVTIF